MESRYGFRDFADGHLHCRQILHRFRTLPHQQKGQPRPITHQQLQWDFHHQLFRGRNLCQRITFLPLSPRITSRSTAPHAALLQVAATNANQSQPTITATAIFPASTVLSSVTSSAAADVANLTAAATVAPLVAMTSDDNGSGGTSVWLALVGGLGLFCLGLVLAGFFR